VGGGRGGLKNPPPPPLLSKALFVWASKPVSRLWKPEAQTNMKLFGLSFSPLEAHESSGYMRSSEDEENRLQWACNTYL
jgi:hypothetical protein